MMSNSSTSFCIDCTWQALAKGGKLLMSCGTSKADRGDEDHSWTGMVLSLDNTTCNTHTPDSEFAVNHGCRETCKSNQQLQNT